MKEEYANNATVQLLKSMGFSDDYIMKGIENGDIDINKAKSTKDMDRSEEWEKDNAKNDEKHIKDLEKDKKEDERDEKDLKRDKKAHEEKEEKKDDLEKSLTPDLMKSLGDSIGKGLLDVLTPVFKGLNSRLDATDEILKSMSKQSPDFRSGNLSNLSTIEKSVSFEKDDNGKVSLSITRQRPAVRKLIEKALDDAEFMKSYGDDAMAYLSYPEADTIGEGLARHMYDKMGVKLER